MAVISLLFKEEAYSDLELGLLHTVACSALVVKSVKREDRYYNKGAHTWSLAKHYFSPYADVFFTHNGCEEDEQ